MVESHSKIPGEPSAGGAADDPLVLHEHGPLVRLDDGEELLQCGEQTGAIHEPLETRDRTRYGADPKRGTVGLRTHHDLVGSVRVGDAGETERPAPMRRCSRRRRYCSPATGSFVWFRRPPGRLSQATSARSYPRTGGGGGELGELRLSLAKALVPNDATAPAFKERHPEFQEFAREIAILLRHNRGVFDGQSTLPARLFPQLALAFVALERFLRILPGVQASANDTLYNLLQRASGGRLRLIQIHDRDATIEWVNRERVRFMHGRPAAEGDRRAAMMALANFADGLVTFVDEVVQQVDVGSGSRKPDVKPARVDLPTRALPSSVSFLSREQEVEQLRIHNIGAAKRGEHGVLLLFAEGALTLMMLEHVCRRVAGSRVRDEDNFRVVVEQAVLHGSAPVRLLATDPVDAATRLVRARDTLIHANYEQIAASMGLSDISEYFKSSQYISEIEALHGMYQEIRGALVARRRRASRRWRRG